jgi:hypothetical protein
MLRSCYKSVRHTPNSGAGVVGLPCYLRVNNRPRDGLGARSPDTLDGLATRPTADHPVTAHRLGGAVSEVGDRGGRK